MLLERDFPQHLASEQCIRGKEAAETHKGDCDAEKQLLTKAFCALKEGLSSGLGEKSLGKYCTVEML